VGHMENRIRELMGGAEQGGPEKLERLCDAVQGALEK